MRLCRNIIVHLHGAGIVLNDELLPCIYVCVEMLIPRTCFSIGVTTHLDVAGTTLHTTEDGGCYICLCKYVSGMCEGMVDW